MSKTLTAPQKWLVHVRGACFEPEVRNQTVEAASALEAWKKARQVFVLARPVDGEYGALIGQGMQAWLTLNPADRLPDRSTVIPLDEYQKMAASAHDREREARIEVERGQRDREMSALDLQREQLEATREHNRLLAEMLRQREERP